MKGLSFLLLVLVSCLTGCGGSQSAGERPLASREVASREELPWRPASTVENVRVTLALGWNAVGLRSPVVTSLPANPEVLGVASYGPGGYTVEPFEPQTLNAGAGGRRGFFIYARSATTFEYSGKDDAQGQIVDLNLAGYQLVSFCTAQDLEASRLQALQNGRSVPLESVISPVLYEVAGNGQSTPVNVSNGVLKAGRPYWVFRLSADPVRLAMDATPPPGSSPSPVVPGPIVRLELSPNPAEVSVPSTLQFRLVATLANGSSQDVTSLANWSSADPSVAALVGPGLFKGINAFSTDVRAELSGQAAVAPLRAFIQNTPGTPSATPKPAASPSPAVGWLYVANNGSGSVRAYTNPSQLTSGQAPDCTINSPTPNGLDLDRASDSLYVTSTVGLVRVYTPASTFAGAFPTRTIGSAINVFSGLKFSNNRLYLGHWGTLTLSILDNASTLDGALPAVGPTHRTLTGFADGPYDVAYDSANDRLFVGDSDRIRVFDNASTASGTVALGRSLTGANTTLSRPLGLYLDTRGSQKLYVRDDNPPRVLTFTGPFGANVGPFAPGVNGNPSPTQSLTGLGGAATGTTSRITGILVDTERDEMYLTDSVHHDRVRVFANANSLPSGSLPAPVRSLVNPGPDLYTVRGIVLDLTR